MRQKIQFLIIAITLAFLGCSSDSSTNKKVDSLMTDTAVIDTTEIKAVPADTTVMNRDSVRRDTVLVKH